MSFTYPLGLLALIGVPIVIIIYIIKNKYTEQIVASTYLWTLSEKFLKRKKQVSLISGIISLILQIIAIILLSLVLSQPVFTIPNVAKDYCFILDGSGSMNALESGISKYELAKKEIEKIILDSRKGSTYTLVFVGDKAKVVYEKSVDKENAIELLNKTEPTGASVDYNNVINYVQNLYNNNPSLDTYLLTDREYETTNITVINVTNDLVNYAIFDTQYEEIAGAVKITGNVISYSKDEVLNVCVYVDETLASTLEVNALKGVKTPFNFICTKTDFTQIKTEIKNEDNLMIDNINIVYNVEKEHSYNALIISDRPFYIESVIKTLGNISVEVISRENYTTEYTGYSLYVFDSFAPSKLPTDGTVWLFGIMNNIEGSGFSVQDVVMIEGYEEENQEENTVNGGMLLTYPKNSTAEFKNLVKGKNDDEIYVAKYAKYGLYRKFTTLLTHDGNPVIFTGSTDAGNIEVVFAFDLHDSNLPLLMDYIVLSRNLLNYSFPNIMEKSMFVCGDIATINVASNFDSIRVESPSGDISYLSTKVARAELKLNEVGTYKVLIKIGDETKEFLLYVNMPEEESNTFPEVESLSLIGDNKDIYINGIYDDLLVFFIILIIVFIADWMVYCYEQRQLR